MSTRSGRSRSRSRSRSRRSASRSVSHSPSRRNHRSHSPSPRPRRSHRRSTSKQMAAAVDRAEAAEEAEKEALRAVAELKAETKRAIQAAAAAKNEADDAKAHAKEANSRRKKWKGVFNKLDVKCGEIDEQLRGSRSLNTQMEKELRSEKGRRAEVEAELVALKSQVRRLSNRVSNFDKAAPEQHAALQLKAEKIVLKENERKMEANNFECSICFDNATLHTALGCGHHYCPACVDRLIQNALQSHTQPLPTCPQCRATFVLADTHPVRR